MKPDIEHHKAWLKKDVADELYQALPKLKSNMWQRYALPDSNVTYNFFSKPKPLMVMNEALTRLTQTINDVFGFSLNVGVVNRYPNGKHGLGMHRDSGIPQLDPNSPIVMVSFGATRAFCLIHGSHKKTLRTVETLDAIPHEEIEVAHGDVLIMTPKCNKTWLHGLLKDDSVTESRTSITLRRHLY